MGKESSSGIWRIKCWQISQVCTRWDKEIL